MIVPHVARDLGRPSAHGYDHVRIADSARTFGKAAAANAPAVLLVMADQNQQGAVVQPDGAERIVEAPVPGT
jgi:hypothetical protein